MLIEAGESKAAAYGSISFHLVLHALHSVFFVVVVFFHLFFVVMVQVSFGGLVI